MLLRGRAMLLRGADLGATFAGMDGVAVNVETASSLGGNCKLASNAITEKVYERIQIKV